MVEKYKSWTWKEDFLEKLGSLIDWIEGFTGIGLAVREMKNMGLDSTKLGTIRQILDTYVFMDGEQENFMVLAFKVRVLELSLIDSGEYSRLVQTGEDPLGFVDDLEGSSLATPYPADLQKWIRFALFKGIDETGSGPEAESLHDRINTLTNDQPVFSFLKSHDPEGFLVSLDKFLDRIERYHGLGLTNQDLLQYGIDRENLSRIRNILEMYIFWDDEQKKYLAPLFKVKVLAMFYFDQGEYSELIDSHNDWDDLISSLESVRWCFEEPVVTAKWKAVALFRAIHLSREFGSAEDEESFLQELWVLESLHPNKPFLKNLCDELARDASRLAAKNGAYGNPVSKTSSCPEDLDRAIRSSLKNSKLIDLLADELIRHIPENPDNQDQLMGYSDAQLLDYLMHDYLGNMHRNNLAGRFLEMGLNKIKNTPEWESPASELLNSEFLKPGRSLDKLLDVAFDDSI